MANRTVLNVGHCGADHPAITRMLRSHFNVDVLGADTAEEALQVLRRQHVDLVLVNRVFNWDSDSGLAFISRMKQEEGLRDIPVMLVSNYDDAQEEAIRRGALPGFGKAALDHPKTLGRLRALLTEKPAQVEESAEKS